MQKAIKRYFPVFVLPTLIAFTIGFLAPFVLGVYLSFCKFTTVTDAKFIGLSNYAKILGDGDFLHSLWFTALFTIVTVLLINIFAFAVAMLLTKSIKGTNIFRTVFFIKVFSVVLERVSFEPLNHPANRPAPVAINGLSSTRFVNAPVKSVILTFNGLFDTAPVIV